MKDKFKSLPESAQQAILDKHRNQGVEYDDWWDCTYDDFKERMKGVGIEVDRMYFSGFWSQGDGACFEGSVCNWPLFLTSINADSCFSHEDVYENMSFSVQHHGHHYHSHSTKYSEEIHLTNLHEEGSIRYHAFEALMDECDEKVEALWESCKEAFRDHMDDLYKSLNEEYDYLTSDEYVLEYLIECDELEGEIDDYIESTAESTEETMAPA